MSTRWNNWSSATKQLEDHINNGQIEEALKLARTATEYLQAELFACKALKHSKSPLELIEATLEVFTATKPDNIYDHGSWVHALSHFTKHLWERRLDNWIKQFNEIAFKGANARYGSPNCSDRLVMDFVENARWDEDPKDFHITPDNIKWMKWNEQGHGKDRLDRSPFPSEIDFLRWKLRLPRYQHKHGVVDSDGLRKMINRLRELNADTSGYASLERELLTKQLSDATEKRKTRYGGWPEKHWDELIQKTKEILNSLE